MYLLHLAAPYVYSTICTTTEQPRLAITPPDLQYTQTVFDHMASKNLQWYNQGICHQVIVNSGMEDLDSPIIGG